MIIKQKLIEKLIYHYRNGDECELENDMQEIEDSLADAVKLNKYNASRIMEIRKTNPNYCRKRGK